MVVHEYWLQPPPVSGIQLPPCPPSEIVSVIEPTSDADRVPLDLVIPAEPPCISDDVVERPPVIEATSPPGGSVVACPAGSATGPAMPVCGTSLEFADYPYAFGNPGVMTYGSGSNWAGTMFCEYGNSFDGLQRRGVGLLVEHECRVGMDFQWDSYLEDLGGGQTDGLHLTNINVLFRVAESPHYLVRAGVGANILGDAFGTDGGFNVTGKVDLFPEEPLVLSGELDLGTIGDAELFHAAGRAGVMIERFELFGGYDYRNVGGAALQGVMCGVQVWY